MVYRKPLDFDHARRPASNLAQARMIFPCRIFTQRVRARVLRASETAPPSTIPPRPNASYLLNQHLMGIIRLHKKHPVTISYVAHRHSPTPIDHPEATSPAATILPTRSSISLFLGSGIVWTLSCSHPRHGEKISLLGILSHGYLIDLTHTSVYIASYRAAFNSCLHPSLGQLSRQRN